MLVKERLAGMGVVVGLTSTCGNGEAILIDVTGPEVASKIQGLLEDAVMVSSTLVVARSTASEAQWRHRVGEFFAEEGNAYVDRVRYRPSAGGGVLAEAPALKEQRDRKRHEAKGSDGKELQVVIRTCGEYAGARGDEAGEHVRMMREMTRIQLKAQATEVVREA